MKTYIVKLESHDDIISTRDKISWSKAMRVLLVWPKKGNVLERRVDMLLMLRHCQQMGVQVALVTRSEAVRDHAREFGIAVFDTMGRAQKLAWRRPKERFDRERLLKLRPPKQPVGDAAALRAAREALHTRPTLNRWLRWGSFVAGLLAVLAMVFFFMPGAQIALSPQREQQQLTIDVWANPDILAPNLSGGVPAYPLRVVVEGREIGTTSGETTIAEGYAAGLVELTNLTDQPVTVPQGSVFLTLDSVPLRFQTIKEVKLSAGPGQTAIATVKCAVPGRKGNVGVGDIRAVEGNLGLQIAVDNPEAMGGGSERTVPAPSARDYTRIREKLLQQLQLTALEELQNTVTADQRLLYQTIAVSEIVKETREPPVAHPADRIQLTLQVEYQAWMVKDSDLRSVANTALDVNLPPGFQPEAQTLRMTYRHEPVLDEANTARWQLDVERSIHADWSEDQIAGMVQGRSPAEAASILQSRFALSAPPKIDLFPAWWVRLPFLPFRIEVAQQ